MKLDGALEFAESYDGNTLDFISLFKGAVKSGMLDNTKGALASPAVIGGIGLLLNVFRNNPGMLMGLATSAGTGGNQ